MKLETILLRFVELERNPFPVKAAILILLFPRDKKNNSSDEPFIHYSRQSFSQHEAIRTFELRVCIIQIIQNKFLKCNYDEDI